MFLFKVIGILFIISAASHARSIKKRQIDARSSAYYSTNGMSMSSYVGYLLGLATSGNSLYPIGNNWFIPNNLPYPYNYQYGIGYQPQYSGYNYGYPISSEDPQIVQYGGSGVGLGHGSNMQAYLGQSYIPSNQWLPLPGADRRRRRRRRR